MTQEFLVPFESQKLVMALFYSLARGSPRSAAMPWKKRTIPKPLVRFSRPTKDSSARERRQLLEATQNISFKDFF